MKLNEGHELYGNHGLLSIHSTIIKESHSFKYNTIHSLSEMNIFYLLHK